MRVAVGARLMNGRSDGQRAGGSVDGRYRAEWNRRGVQAVSGWDPPEHGDAEAGQTVTQDVDNAPPAERRVVGGAFKTKRRPGPLSRCRPR